MSEHMKKHRISAHRPDTTLYITHREHIYAIPKKIADKYLIEDSKAKQLKINLKKTLTLKEMFVEFDKKYMKAGALLKGLRYRENLSQADFAKKIHVTQANLSKMENGKRPIGKIISKRIEKIFGTNYRYFLE